MKKLVLLIMAYVLLAWTATDFSSKFADAINNNNAVEADSLVRIWEVSSPDDPELVPARAILSQYKAQTLLLRPTDTVYNDGAAFFVADSVGNMISLIERMTDDSVYQQSMDEIDRGIAMYPNILPFRVIKASRASLFSDWPEVLSVMGAVLDSGDYQWLWVDRHPIGDTVGVYIRSVITDFMHVMGISGDTAAVSMAEALGRKALARYPEDPGLLIEAGCIANQKDEFKTALDFFERADELQPGNWITRYNIASAKLSLGDTVAALAICSEIAGSNCPEMIKAEAAGLEKKMMAQPQTMPLYDYFFKWLPAAIEVYGNLENMEQRYALLGNAKLFNDVLPPKYGFRSPFDSADIYVYKYDVGKRKFFVWTFPKPEEAPMCSHVAFVVEGNHVRFFTLEKSIDGAWVLGTMENGTHSNFGAIARYPESPWNFVDAIVKKSGGR